MAFPQTIFTFFFNISFPTASLRAPALTLCFFFPYMLFWLIISIFFSLILAASAYDRRISPVLAVGSIYFTTNLCVMMLVLVAATASNFEANNFPPALVFAASFAESITFRSPFWPLSILSTSMPKFCRQPSFQISLIISSQLPSCPSLGVIFTTSLCLISFLLATTSLHLVKSLTYIFTIFFDVLKIYSINFLNVSTSIEFGTFIAICLHSLFSEMFLRFFSAS